MTHRKKRLGGKSKYNCKFTGKKRFRDKKEAIQSLRALKKHSERESIPQRCFYCSMCNGYHLTHMDLFGSKESDCEGDEQ